MAILYDPPGPLSEALASCYVRRLVQQAIDRAFKLHPAPAQPACHRA